MARLGRVPVRLPDPPGQYNASYMQQLLQDLERTLSAISTMSGSAISVIATGSTTARTLSDRFAEVFNVKDYGAIGDGTTNDTAAIQAANDACEAAGGGTVYFPDGTYSFTSVTVDSGYVQWIGTGHYASILKCTSANGGVLFTGTSLPLCGVEKLGFLQSVDSTTSTAALLKTSGVFRFHVKDCFFNGYSGASNYAHNLLYLNGTSIYIAHCEGSGGKTCGIYITSGNDYFISNCTFNQSATTGRPLYVDDVTGGAVVIEGSAFLEGASCRFENSKYMTVTGTYFDSSQNGVEVDTCEHLYFTGCEFANRPGDGVTFTSSKYWELNGCMVINCGDDGVVVASGCSDWVIANCIIDGNNTGNTANKAGIQISADTSGFQIVGNRIGNLTSGFSGHQKYGIAINTGTSDNYIIANNDLRTNDTGGLADNGSGLTKHIWGNLGVVPNSVAGYLVIDDGLTAPTSTTGQAKIFVDTADGDLKVIFGDGTTKTIVTDT